ncbi:hypothetical protein [Vreelandella massiliensis]|uniref:hypothetical protein n=1 Tax=Vreelandella massiliensis TaxID=1816686 RepID=UPI00096A46AC|nr:hypothetical protein [Halomonas massiliensis]
MKSYKSRWNRVKGWLALLVFVGLLISFGIMVLLGLPIGSANGTNSYHQATGLARLLGIIPLGIGSAVLYAAISLAVGKWRDERS